MINYLKEAVQELTELDKILCFDIFTYTAAEENIHNLASESEHMNISEFVDMCLDMARCGTNLGA